jgi:hypothetical protein
VGKSVGGLWIREGFRRKEKRLDVDLERMRNLALMVLNTDAELPRWQVLHSSWIIYIF